MVESEALAGNPDGRGDLPVPKVSHTPVPFPDLIAPQPVPAEPPGPARWLAFAGVLVGGLLGGLIGYGTGDLLTDGGPAAALGGLAGATIGAVGVGIVASLTLRAMNEWQEAQHPEAASDQIDDLGSS